MNPKRIVIDGKVYNSVDQMPEEVRRQYEQAMSSLKDQNGNRVPDTFENKNILADNNRNGVPDILENTAGAPVFQTAMKIIVDGKEFHSLDDLPPEARAKFEKAMGALDANSNGIPDFVEGMMGMQHSASAAPTGFEIKSPRQQVSRPPIASVNSAITPDTSKGWTLALLGLVLLILCAAGAAGVWYFFFR